MAPGTSLRQVNALVPSSALETPAQTGEPGEPGAALGARSCACASCALFAHHFGECCGEYQGGGGDETAAIVA